MAAVLTGTYDSQLFDLIPDFTEALVSFVAKRAREAVDELGKVFVKHDMFTKYGLIMVHRHFPMSTDEILVETFKDDGSVSVSMPWKMNGKQGSPSDVAYWNSFGFAKGNSENIIPYTWSFDSRTEGLLQPFEFLTTEKLEEEPSANFISDLYKELKKLGLENVFGLRRIRNNSKAYETTPDGVRANIVKYGNIPSGFDKKDFVEVVFLIDEEGRGRVGTACLHCQHCYHS